MDEIDKNILTILHENSRTSFSEISKKVNLSAPAVKDRIIKLEEAGIINNYTIQIDQKKIGKQLTAFVLFETINCQAFREFCSAHESVSEYHRLAGKYSYLVKVSVASMDELEAFIDDTMKFGVPSTHIVFSSFDNISL